jgi:hypothetical protein
MKLLLLLVATITLAACVRPGDHPISSNCLWTEEDSRTLDLTRTFDRRHLRFDAITAEDMAIRWADKYFGHLPEYDERCSQCMVTLFEGVAKQHGVDVSIVLQYSLKRDVIVDAATILSFAGLYAVVAYIVAGRIRRRFPPGEQGFWLMTLTLAAGVSVIGLAIGNLWSIVIETFQLNSVHLSYRMNRIPWRQHWAALFFGGFVVFMLAALMRSRIKLSSVYRGNRC